MKPLLLYSILIFSLASAYGQEPLNQYDTSGKKDGKWIVFLDAFWNKTDSSKAHYYRYTWYDHGVNIQPMGAGGGKDSELKSKMSLFNQGDQPVLLDGEYSWFENEKLKYVHVLKNGEYVSYKEYSKKGMLKSYFDYSEGCKGQAHSWTLYVCDKDGNIIKSGTMCKDKDGDWPRMSD